MRLLFYKRRFAWPRSSGHDVHTFHMMKALASLGCELSLATMEAPAPEAIDGLDLGRCVVLPGNGSPSPGAIRATRAEERYRSYWGVPAAAVAGLAAAARDLRADAVVVSGLDVLPMLCGIEGALRVWYAADEWFWHHCSQLQVTRPSTWSELKTATVKGLYERAHRRRLDRVWVVSAADATAMRWIAGVRNVDILPNGVDTDLYGAAGSEVTPETCVFWGRLDFGPNIQALEWFCGHVWPAVRARHPQATFTVIGFQPGEEVQRLVRLPGVRLEADVPDIRTAVAGQAVVVLPFVSGGGIKNKLLEAAAMAKAVVCTPRALGGLNGHPPVRVARSTADWCEAIESLWSDPPRRLQVGLEAREWVIAEHTWTAAARKALDRLRQSPSPGAVV